MAKLDLKITAQGFDVLMDGEKCGYVDNSEGVYALEEFNFHRFALDADELRQLAGMLDLINGVADADPAV